MGWYFANNGQQVGPISDEELNQLLVAGTITAATLVWRQGQGEWKSYAEVFGLGVADADRAICAVSGKVRPKRDMVQYEGHWVSAEHRDEFFQRLREGLPVTPALAAAVPGPYGYGGFWWRLLAAVIDYVTMYVVTQIVNMIFMFLFLGSTMLTKGNPTGRDAAQMFLYVGVTFTVTIGIRLGYYWFFLHKFQATPGKLAAGVKVVRSDGSRLSHGRIVGRFFAEWISAIILCIGYLMAAWDDEKRTLHDRICDTRVIRTRA